MSLPRWTADVILNAAQDEANSAGAICQLSGLWRDHSLHNMPAAVHARGVWHHVGRGEPSTPPAPLQPTHLGSLCLRFYVGYVQTCASGVMLQTAVRNQIILPRLITTTSHAAILSGAEPCECVSGGWCYLPRTNHAAGAHPTVHHAGNVLTNSTCCARPNAWRSTGGAQRRPISGGRH